MALEDRLKELGQSLGERESGHSGELAAAREKAEALREQVAGAIAVFQSAAAAAGAPHLEVEVGDTQTDEKHLRAVEFDLRRGKHRAIVTAKSRGDVTLVGPFRVGKAEGPCRSFPLNADAEIETALEEFLVSFLEEAATP